MAAELRLILLGLGLVLLVGIWWWAARRSGGGRGTSELRAHAPPPDPRYAGGGEEEIRPHPAARDDWGVPPFEPLSIRTAEFDQVPVLDGPMIVHPDPEPLGVPPSAVTAAAVPAAAAAARAVPVLEPAPAARMPAPARAPAVALPDSGQGNAGRAGVGAAAAAAGNATELQRIITVRVCAVGDVRWRGAQLMGALELHGLAFGRYQVFHRKHADGRSLFCVASLIEPGTFDIAAMPEQEFRGVTLFAVLPGPIAPLDTFDELLATARGLADELAGMLQDAKGMPLSPQRAAALREDVARFQAALPRA